MINGKQNKDFIFLRYRINPNAFMVKGFSRSIICDTDRSLFLIIPNSMYDILMDEEVDSVKKAFEKYAPNNMAWEEIILEYYEKMIDLDLLFFSNYPMYYKNIEIKWDHPSFITNAIIDFDETSNFEPITAINQLPILGCQNIQIRAYSIFLSSKIENILISINDSIIESIHFIIPFVSDKETETLVLLSKKYPRIRFIQLFNAHSKYIIYSNNNKSTNIVSVKNSLLSEKCCGVVSNHYFSTALSTFTESHHHNSCLNRKISIDIDGNIKNCPSMPQSFGNIKDTTLQEALDHPDFKKYWNVTKDQIAVCKDCEFRYICTDCRAYIENPEDMYSKPLKCGYNPYTCEWEEWSTNPLKQQAIDYYGMREVLPEFNPKPDYVPPSQPKPARNTAQ